MGWLNEPSLDESARKMVRRLRVADGHLQGIIRMVESGAECHAVLNQLIAVKSSLEKTALYLLACYGQEAIARTAGNGRTMKIRVEGADALFNRGGDAAGGNSGDSSNAGGENEVRAVLDEVLAMAAKLLS